MEIGTFIDRLTKTRFVFTGVYCSSHPVWAERPFEVTFEIGRGESSLFVEGGVRRRHAEPPFAFEIEIPFSTVSPVSCSVRVRSQQTGELEGQLLSSREGFEILASAGTSTLCSLHLQFFEKSAFEVSGMLSLQDHALSFAARESGHWQKLASAKVIPIGERR
jgi:hypothetical protein